MQESIVHHEPVPLYYQLEILIRGQIESGLYGPGDMLPPETALAAEHGISRMTVRQALQRLEDEGLISRRRGKGTFVTESAGRKRKVIRRLSNVRGFEHDLERQGLTVSAEVLGIEEITAEGSFVALMDVPKGSELIRVRRLAKDDGSPLWLETRYFPKEIGNAVIDKAELSAPAIMPVIEKHTGKCVEGIDVLLEAAVCTRRQSDLLNIPTGSPVHLYEKRVSDEEGAPLLLMRAVFPAANFRFSYSYSRQGSLLLGPNELVSE